MNPALPSRQEQPHPPAQTGPRLALYGGAPVRRSPLPYGRQSIDSSDLNSVARVLRSDWLTTGPEVIQFETRFAQATGCRAAVAVSSGTAALHAAVACADLGPGDEVLVSPMTFAASANCVVYQGARPIFVDVREDSLLIDPDRVEGSITPRTKAIIAVDYAGQACSYDRLKQIASQRGLTLIADACHSLGGQFQGRPVGTLADLTTFSLHPVKPITCGEGGVVTTDDPATAERLRRFRNHGISADHESRQQQGTWRYDMEVLGFNYRLTDLQCALAGNQLQRLGAWTLRRQEIAATYDSVFSEMSEVAPLSCRPDVSHARHLYVLRFNLEQLNADQQEIFSALRAEGILVNVHYRPVHLHSFYRRKFGTGEGECPIAESAYRSIVSLPIFPAMTQQDVDDVVAAVEKVVVAYRKRRVA